MTSNILVINARQRTISITTEEDHLLNLGLAGSDFDSAEVVDEETREELLPMSAEAAEEYINNPYNGWDEEDIAAAQKVISEFRLEEAKEAFSEAFTSRIQELVPDFDCAADGETPNPWCAPWFWSEMSEFLPKGMDGEEAGRRWAEQCAPEIAEIVAKERAVRAEFSTDRTEEPLRVFYCMEVENPQSLSKARKIEATNLASAKRIASRNRVFVGTTLVIGNSVNSQGFVTEPVCVKVSDEKWKTVAEELEALKEV